MADTDFYKQEIERLQRKLADWQRVYLESIGLLAKLGVTAQHKDVSPQDMVRVLFDRIESLNIAYKQTIADAMFLQKALDETITAARIDLSRAWVDFSDGAGENCNEFSISPQEVPSLVKYLQQKQCCGNARCYHQSSGVKCAIDTLNDVVADRFSSPLPELTRLMDEEGVYDRSLANHELNQTTILIARLDHEHNERLHMARNPNCACMSCERIRKEANT